MAQILIIKMINNDNNQLLQVTAYFSKALLNWIQTQAQQIYSSSKKKINVSLILQNIYSQNFLGKILLKINYEFFNKTQIQDLIESPNRKKFSFYDRKIKYLNLVQKYVRQFQRKKFKPNYRELLFKDQQAEQKQKYNNEIIKIILFLAIRSQNKNEFIQRIFKMTVQDQQLLMDQIMKVENNMQNITQKQQITLQLNILKGINKKMKAKYQQLVDYQNNLIQRCQKQSQSLQNLQEKHQQIIRQKIFFCQQTKITNPQRPYLKIYKNFIEKNLTLTKILTQKQKKENQLYEQHLNLKDKVDQIQQALFQLGGQRKKFKIILNDKKNESFHLQMRASLKIQKQQLSLRKSQAMRRKSFMKNGHNQERFSNYLNRYSLNLNKQNVYQQKRNLNQSINMISKLQQLEKQKQELAKDYLNVKNTNQTLKKKQSQNKKMFSQLSQIYSQVICQISHLGQNNLPRQIQMVQC